MRAHPRAQIHRHVRCTRTCTRAARYAHEHAQRCARFTCAHTHAHTSTHTFEGLTGVQALGSRALGLGAGRQPRGRAAARGPTRGCGVRAAGSTGRCVPTAAPVRVPHRPSSTRCSGARRGAQARSRRSGRGLRSPESPGETETAPRAQNRDRGLPPVAGPDPGPPRPARRLRAPRPHAADGLAFPIRLRSRPPVMSASATASPDSRKCQPSSRGQSGSQL